MRHWTLKARLPAIYGTKVFAEDGGLPSYGADILDQSRRVAGYVGKILKGAKLGDLSIEQATKLQLACDPRPPFEMVSVELSAFEHLNHKGSLHITLFNDRLLGIWFYPKHAETYLKALRQSGVVLVEDRELVHGNVVMRQSRDQRENFYVARQDKRLAEESRKWIRCYA